MFWRRSREIELMGLLFSMKILPKLWGLCIKPCQGVSLANCLKIKWDIILEQKKNSTKSLNK